MLQSEALDILKMGKNVFLTGPAGSGKTHVVNEYVKYLKSMAVDVAVTASTGIAATHIGGMTIHSWSGLGIRDRLTDYDIDDLMQRQYLYKRFERTKVLIIDEVSMLHHYRLDLSTDETERQAVWRNASCFVWRFFPTTSRNSW